MKTKIALIELCQVYREDTLKIFQDQQHLDCKDELFIECTKTRGRKEDGILSGQHWSHGAAPTQWPAGCNWQHLHQSAEIGWGCRSQCLNELWRKRQTPDYRALVLIHSNSLQPNLCFLSTEYWGKGLSQLLEGNPRGGEPSLGVEDYEA